MSKQLSNSSSSGFLLVVHTKTHQTTRRYASDCLCLFKSMWIPVHLNIKEVLIYGGGTTPLSRAL
jgi:hypothetical protein